MGRGGARPGAGRRRKDPEPKRPTIGSRGAGEIAVPGADAGTAAMIPPLHLSDLAQLMFGQIADMLEQQKRASPHFAQHVALLALRLEQIQRWQAVLEMSGDTFTSRTVKKIGEESFVTEMVRARPEVAMLSDAMRQAQSLIGELMLNPIAAMRVAAPAAKKAGAFDDF